MMGRPGRSGLIALFFLGSLGVIWAQARLPSQPPVQSILQSPILRPWQKAPVVFRHQHHEARQIACTTCHHEYEGGRNRWQEGQPVQKCQACHLNRPQADRLDLKNAFHRQCKGCHLQRRQRGQRAGPIRCQDCHQRPISG